MKTNLLLVLVVILSLAACNKNTNPRSTQYLLIPQNNSGIAGTVTFNEQINSGTTQVDVELSNTMFYHYSAHIHQGPPSGYHGAVYTFDPMYASGGRLSYKQSIPLLYDSAIVYNGTFVLHDSTTNNVLGLCGIGINR